MKKLFLYGCLLFSAALMASPGDTLMVKTFSFDSITTRRACFSFPDSNEQYGKILMYYTLKCDEATPHDKYPCGEWDYTTYTRVYLQGEEEVDRTFCPSFKVKNHAPKQYAYTEQPTWRVFSWYDHRKEGEPDYFLHFDGDDYLSVPSQALASVKEAFTASFWILGDPVQPRRDAVFEATNSRGERVINLHLPYDNERLYFDAGGYGQGKNDNVSLKMNPLHYKGVWTHYAVSKNSVTGMQRVYRNGVLILEKETGKRSMEGITSLTIGALDNKKEQFYAGSLDEIMMWNRELSAEEIRQTMYPKAESIPARDALLLWYPMGKEGQKIILDRSGNEQHAMAWGVPRVCAFEALPSQKPKPRPGQQLRQDSVPNAKVHIVLYDDTLHPDRPTDTLFVYPGYRYHCSVDGTVLDSVVVASSRLLQRETRVLETRKPAEEVVEIARFITPYGKHLDLGLNGFTWVYEVTPYAPLLKGIVDLQAGNGQELIDLRFAFIEGEGEKDPVAVKNIYPYGSYAYEDLADDEALQNTIVRFHPQTKQAYLRARISGHGHAGPRNCCEWDPKTHYMLVNGDTLWHWRVWRDCGMNPLYPQGGTWQFDRAGWCPGTFVDTYDFRIPDSLLAHGIAGFDYAIQPYNLDNGEEKGYFEMAIQLLEYGATNFKKDASIEGIMAPSDQHEYRRYNPVSTRPIIRVRNSGEQEITSMNIKYGLEKGRKSYYQWEGLLLPGEEIQMVLPKPSWKRMRGGDRFVAEIKKVEGRNDFNSLNNRQTSVVEEPVILPKSFLIEVKTQGLGRAVENTLTITNQEEEVVFQRTNYPEDTLIKDKVVLDRGAYVFTFSDEKEDGLIRHWWNYFSDKKSVGENGALRILEPDGTLILDLGYDWAAQRRVAFFVGNPW